MPNSLLGSYSNMCYYLNRLPQSEATEIVVRDDVRVKRLRSNTRRSAYQMWSVRVVAGFIVLGLAIGDRLLAWVKCFNLAAVNLYSAKLIFQFPRGRRRG